MASPLGSISENGNKASTIFLNFVMKASTYFVILGFIAVVAFALFIYPHLPSHVWLAFAGRRHIYINGDAATGYAIEFTRSGLQAFLIIVYIVYLLLVVLARLFYRFKNSNNFQSGAALLASLPSFFVAVIMSSIYVSSVWQLNLSQSLTVDQANANNGFIPGWYVSLIVAILAIAVLFGIPYYRIQKQKTAKKKR